MDFYDLWHAIDSHPLLNEVQQVGYDQIKEKQLFGPVYHGTTQENLKRILDTGFKIRIGGARAGDKRHGFEIQGWGGTNIPPPCDFLGFGIYFTQSKTQAKLYNNNSLRGIRNFYLDVPRLEIINFAAPWKMAQFWVSNGYDMEPIENANDYGGANTPWGRLPARKSYAEIQEVEKKRVEATKRMTEILKSKWDAVLFTGKSMYGSNLDGNQICVYDPSRIYLFDPELNPTKGYYVGDRAKVKGVAVTVKLGGKREANNPYVTGGSRYKGPWEYLLGPSDHYYYASISPADCEKIKQYYYPQLIKVMTEDPELRQQLDKRADNFEGTFEDSIKQYADYLTGTSLKLNFPEALLERKLKKGERLK